jgi:hypothetical protein
MIRAAALAALFAAASTLALAQTPEKAPEPRAPDRGVMQKQDTFRDAALSPLEDLNLKQSTIPDVLNRAVANPYDMEGLGRCEAIAGEVGKLDAALGSDLDEAPPPDGRSRLQKAGSAVRSAGVAAVRDETGSVLPFRGWVRKLTGASRHDKAVAQAIRSGGIRRGYLKGVGMQKNCAPPAAPSWFIPVEVKASNPVAAHGATGIIGMLIRFFAWIRSLLPF